MDMGEINTDSTGGDFFIYGDELRKITELGFFPGSM
jgi:hypothetical protein